MTPAKTDPITAYAQQVRSRKIPAGALHRAACVRHLRDQKTAKARGLIWNKDLAAEACRFFTLLRHYKGEWAGQPLTLQPWQAFIVGSLFGWQRKADRLRRFRTAFVEVPRGNGKSTLAGGLLLLGAFFDSEPGAECYAAATKRDQARIVFDAARQMVLRSGLRSRITVQQHNLHQPASASKVEPLGADADTMDGLRPHVVVIDEIHAHKTSAVLDVLQTGMSTRRQPLTFEITTAGVDRTGPWWAHREYTRLVLEGRAEDDAWFGLICGADQDDDWTDPVSWAKANPNYGQSVKCDYLEAECRKAEAMTIFQGPFRRLHVGQLVEQQDKVIDRRAWDAAADPSVTLASLQGATVVGGLDLATTTDITALVLACLDADGSARCVPVFWVPGETLQQRVQRDRVPYDIWARSGLLRVTEGNVTDYDRVRADILDLTQQLSISEIAYDPWNATQLALQLQSDGLPMVEVRPGYRHLSEATKRLIAMVTAGELRHPGHPVLTWMADNLAVSMDPAGNLRPDKAKATERIDGMVALIMALARLVTVAQPGPSVYETRDVLVL